MRLFRAATTGASASRQQPGATAPVSPGPSNTAADIEAGTSGTPMPGLTFRSSSRSSSPCAGSPGDSRESHQSPRGKQWQQQALARHGWSSSSQSPTKPGTRGKERHLCLLLLLLLPALTGLGVMAVRLRASEAEHHALDMPPLGKFNSAKHRSSSSFPSSSAAGAWSSSNGRFAFASSAEEGSFSFMHQHSFQEMRNRQRDRLPKWARKCVDTLKRLFSKDPVLAYLLPDGPAAWTYQWLIYGKRNPMPLWDARDFGPAANFLWGSGNQMCSILNATDDIALVGNGPLTEEQRQQISKAGRVVRFNALNNRVPGERVDIWLVRYNGMGPANYWGFKQLRYREAEEVTRQAAGIVFLGGHPTRFMAYAVEELLTWYPFVPVEKTMQINITGYWDLYNAVLSDSTSLRKAGAMPSSGLLGVLATVACMRPDQKLRIFGFNWNPQNWFMHKMDSEQKIIRRLLAGRQVEINPTACDGMYTCDKLCDSLFYRLAKDGDKTTCEARAKEHDAREKAEEDARKRLNRQRATDALYGSTSFGRQAALEAATALKEHNSTPEVPDWVMDNSIKFEGKAREAAASFGVTGAPGGDQHKQTSALGHGQLPVAVEEREDGFLYNKHGERLGRADALGAGSVAAIMQEPQKKRRQGTGGIEQLAADELLALQNPQNPQAATLVPPEAEDVDYSYDDMSAPDEPSSDKVTEEPQQELKQVKVAKQPEEVTQQGAAEQAPEKVQESQQPKEAVADSGVADQDSTTAIESTPLKKELVVEAAAEDEEEDEPDDAANSVAVASAALEELEAEEAAAEKQTDSGVSADEALEEGEKEGDEVNNGEDEGEEEGDEVDTEEEEGEEAEESEAARRLLMEALSRRALLPRAA